MSEMSCSSVAQPESNPPVTTPGTPSPFTPIDPLFARRGRVSRETSGMSVLSDIGAHKGMHPYHFGLIRILGTSHRDADKSRIQPNSDISEMPIHYGLLNERAGYGGLSGISAGTPHIGALRLCRTCPECQSPHGLTDIGYVRYFGHTGHVRSARAYPTCTLCPIFRVWGDQPPKITRMYAPMGM